MAGVGHGANVPVKRVSMGARERKTDEWRGTMSDERDDEKDGSPEGENFIPTICPSSFTHPEMALVPRRAWEDSQARIRKLSEVTISLKAEVERVRTEHERLKEAAYKLRKQLYDLQELTGVRRGVVN
jgi:hypothetical protein